MRGKESSISHGKAALMVESLDFEADGVEYRLVRTLDLQKKQDDFHLYRLATMVECEIFHHAWRGAF